MSALVIRTASFLILVLALVAPASAYNLVNNPSFAGNTNGWSVAGNVTFDASNDATGAPGSGSAQSAFVAGGASTQLALSQCIVTGPGGYTLGGKVLIPNGQAVGGQGLVTVSFFSAPGCSTGLLGSSFLSTATTGSFQTLSGPITAPAGTVAIWITGQNNAAAAGTHVVNFDDFVLDNGQPPPPPVVPAPTTGWLALMALAAMLLVMGSVFTSRRD